MRAKAPAAFALLAAMQGQTHWRAAGEGRFSRLLTGAAGSAICFPKGIDRSMKSYYNDWYDFILGGE